MPEINRLSFVIRRLEKCETALAAIRRIREELRSIRVQLPAGDSPAKVDEMLRLNTEKITAIRKGLTMAENNFGRT